MVIAIIAVLVSLLLPALGRAQDAAKNVACKSNLRQIALGILTYAADNKQYAPPTVGGESTGFQTKDGAIDGYFHQPPEPKRTYNTYRNRLFACPGRTGSKGYKSESHDRTNTNNAIYTDYYITFRSATPAVCKKVNTWAGWYHIEGVPINVWGFPKSMSQMINLNHAGRTVTTLYHNDTNLSTGTVTYRPPSRQVVAGDPVCLTALINRKLFEKSDYAKIHKGNYSNVSFVDGHVGGAHLSSYSAISAAGTYWREFNQPAKNNGGLAWME